MASKEEKGEFRLVNEERLLARINEVLKNHYEASRKHKQEIVNNIKAKITEEFSKVEVEAKKRDAAAACDSMEIMDRICRLEQRVLDLEANAIYQVTNKRRGKRHKVVKV